MAEVVKGVAVKIEVTGYEDARLKIDRLTLAAKELSDQHPEIKPELVDKAKVLLEARLLRDAIKKELAGSVMSGGGGGGGLFRNLLSSGGGGILTGATNASQASIPMAGNIYGLAAAGGAVAALLPELTAIVSGLAAATAGAGAFGAVAMPTFQKLTGDISAVHDANEKFQESALNVDTAIKHSALDAAAYNAALAKMPPNLASATKLLGDQNGRWQDLSKSQQNNVTALANNKAAMASLLPSQKTALTALLAAKTAWDDMNPAQQRAATSMNQLSNAYQKIVTALQPDVFKVLNAGLAVANKLLPALQPLATAGANAIDGLLGKLSKFVGSSGFKDWLKQFTALAGPSITAIGTGVGHLVAAIGKLFTVMSAKDVVHGINIAFGVLTGTIDAVAGAVRWLMNTWDLTALRFPAIAAVVLRSLAFMLSGVQFFTDHVLGMFKRLIDGAAMLVGWVPGFGSGVKTAAKYFDNFYNSVHSNLSTAQDDLKRWATDMTNAPKIFRIRGEITDLEAKLATAERELKNPDLTRTRRAALQADISNLLAQIARAKGALNALNGYSATTYIYTNTVGRPTGMPHAASGGYRSGRTLVGELGPEVVDLPRGSLVHSNAQSRSMLGGGDTYNITVNVPPTVNPKEAGRQVAQLLLAHTRTGGRLYPQGTTAR